jgi:hypothetical protein
MSHRALLGSEASEPWGAKQSNTDRAPPLGGGASGGVLSSASDDGGGGLPARSAPSERGERGNQIRVIASSEADKLEVSSV